jgi:hypothetical protein
MEITLLDPIPPLDTLRPAKLPSLPQWLEGRLASLKKETQPDQSGRYREVYVLPSNQMLNENQRREIDGHVRALNEIDEMTPEKDQRSAARTLAAVSKILLALSGQPIEGLSAEAKGEAYIVALDDVPYWAVEEVIRKWYRGEFKGQYNFRWPPDPATLRKLACGEQFAVRNRAHRLQILLHAEARVELPEEHRQKMLELLTGLNALLKKQ